MVIVVVVVVLLLLSLLLLFGGSDLDENKADRSEGEPSGEELRDADGEKKA